LSNSHEPIPPKPSGQKALAGANSGKKPRAKAKQTAMKRPAAANVDTHAKKVSRRPSLETTPLPKHRAAAVDTHAKQVARRPSWETTPPPKHRVQQSSPTDNATPDVPKKTKPSTVPQEEAESRRLLKNARSKAYHQARLQAARQGLSEEEAKARGCVASEQAKKLFLDGA